MNTRAATLSEPLFFSATLGSDGDATLTGDEAHHVTVQRLRAGDPIALFDGDGHVARGEIASITRGTVRIAVTRRYRDPPPEPRLDLYCAVPKGERAAVLLDMATQLGMTGFAPVRWHRRVAEAGARAQQRWRRICIEACKQSRRTYVPAIAPDRDAAAAIEHAKASHDVLLVAHPGEASLPLARIERRAAQAFALFVGPEGGFTDEEIALLADHGAKCVRLGSSILRIETAAVALLAALGLRDG